MIFVDTGAWIAIEDRKDVHHKKAMDFKNKILVSRSRLITTNYVLDETYTLMLVNYPPLTASQYSGSLSLVDQLAC